MPLQLAIQDYYPDDFNHCYGCGQLNPAGLQLRTFWEGDQTVSRFVPRPEHTAIPGFVYGGLIASLIDCHGTGSAAAAAYRAEGRDLGSEPPLRFVTATLEVRYRRPTPLGPELVLRGRVGDATGKRVTVDIELFAEGELCAQGKVVAARLPPGWGAP